MPQTDTAVLQAIADEASNATSTARTVSVLGSTGVVEPAMLRSWVVLNHRNRRHAPTWVIDSKKSLLDLQAMFPNLGSADQQAHFDVVDGKPIIVPPSSSVFCCQADSPELIRAALLAGSETIELLPETAGGDDAVKALEALGIVEEVSTFTTKHNCCENRVTNIHRMADLVRGHVVMPGEQFSLNNFVGKRTESNGFLPAGAIADGIIEAQVGGGVSQFTTTIFNAVFFAGLQFDEYQSHSIYFSRYPYGREATVSYPAPDFKFTNNSPYGVLIWPTYTDNSITVTFYSTKNVTVEDVGRTETSQGECTRVTTKRQLTYNDGTVKNDSVFAVYRPGEGLDCNGNPTKSAPTTEPPATTTSSESPDQPATTAATNPPATTTTAAPAETTTSSGG
ncbi:MAG: VanW family protein [Acidimicrobiales bacterium]